MRNQLVNANGGEGRKFFISKKRILRKKTVEVEGGGKRKLISKPFFNSGICRSN